MNVAHCASRRVCASLLAGAWPPAAAQTPSSAAADGVRGVRPGPRIQADRPAVRAEDADPRHARARLDGHARAADSKRRSGGRVLCGKRELRHRARGREPDASPDPRAVRARPSRRGHAQVGRPSHRHPDATWPTRVSGASRSRTRSTHPMASRQSRRSRPPASGQRGAEARVRRERPAGRAIRPQRIGRGGHRRTIGCRHTRSHWTLVDERLHAPLNQMAVVLARTKQPRAAMSFIEFVNGVRGPGRHAAVRLPACPARSPF